MKLLVLLMIAMLVMGSLSVGMALAQENPDDSGSHLDLPATATGGVNQLAVLLAGLAGLLATAVTEAFKKWTWLKEDDRARISGPMADLLAQWAQVLDEKGIWQVVLFTWPAAKGWFEVAARRKVARANGVGN